MSTEDSQKLEELINFYPFVTEKFEFSHLRDIILEQARQISDLSSKNNELSCSVRDLEFDLQRLSDKVENLRWEVNRI